MGVGSMFTLGLGKGLLRPNLKRRRGAISPAVAGASRSPKSPEIVRGELLDQAEYDRQREVEAEVRRLRSVETRTALMIEQAYYSLIHHRGAVVAKVRRDLMATLSGMLRENPRLGELVYLGDESELPECSVSHAVR